jgi:hypothetical protein
MTNPEYLRDLAERLMAVPVSCRVDQSDVDRLNHIAHQMDEANRFFAEIKRREENK